MTTGRILAVVISFFVLACALGYAFLAKPHLNPGYISYSWDAHITKAIKSGFMLDKAASGTSISVSTLDGVVLLSGYAKSAEEKSAAEGIAHRVKGVKSVKNEVIVRP